MSTAALPVGVIGVGHLGRFHAQKYQQHPMVHLVGVYDTDAARAASVAQECATQAFSDMETLLKQVRAVSVVTPTSSHFEVVKACLEADVHVLVEKPFADEVAQADALMAMQQARGLVLSVGHLKRLHPAILHLKSLRLGSPRYIEAERLAPFKARSLDVDVIMDLMIHDLDLALSATQSECQDARAVGVAVVTDKLDMANAWISFANGCVANVSASRVAREAVRKMRLFWTDCYASVDFLNNSLHIYRRSEQDPSSLIPGARGGQVSLDKTDVLAREVDAFLATVMEGKPNFCDAEAGRQALSLACQVRAAIQARMS